jgi:hypothetical protein
MGRVPVEPRVGEGLVVRRIVMRAPDVVFFKGVIEASDGLAVVFAVSGCDLVVAAPEARREELDAVLVDLCAELRAVRLS